MTDDPTRATAAGLYWWLRRAWGRAVDAYWDRQARKHPVELHPVREINLLNRLDAALADRRGFVVHYICCGREWLQPQTFSTWEQADQHRTWYVEQEAEGHERVAIVNHDRTLFGWPA